MNVIALEGINGAGKSSIGALIQRALHDAGRPCLLVDPAGAGPIGTLIRKRIVHPSVRTNPELDAGLYAALRTEGARCTLESSAASPSGTLILERWSLALSAYGTADGADAQLLLALRQALADTLTVDVTILLDVSVDIALQRLGGTVDQSRFEARDKLESVARWYRHFAQQETRTIVVDASSDLSSTFHRVRLALTSTLGA